MGKSITVTPRARQALESARQLARDLGHARVGSQHIVFGLFQLGSGVHFHMLRALGFTTEGILQSIAAEAPIDSVSDDDPVPDISATEVLNRSETEATTMNHSIIGTEHILLALLSERHGGAARLFTTHGVDVAATRQTILRELQTTT